MYNLNFIDWDNEFEADMYGQEGDECPIEGMDMETYMAIQQSYFSEEERNNAVQQSAMERMPEKIVTKVREENSCAICMKTYSKGDKVFFNSLRFG